MPHKEEERAEERKVYKKEKNKREHILILLPFSSASTGREPICTFPWLKSTYQLTLPVTGLDIILAYQKIKPAPLNKQKQTSH